MRQSTSLQIEWASFDGAHDAAGFYRLGHAWKIPLIIPLAGPLPKTNEGRDADGTPLCQAGARMYADGYQTDRQRTRWHCPLMKGPARGDVTTCPHLSNCSTAKNGRIVYTYPGRDARLNTIPPRGTESWQLLYNHRTACERTNSRQAYHLKLKATRTRGGNRWLFRTFLSAAAQYLIAWSQHQATPP